MYGSEQTAVPLSKIVRWAILAVLALLVAYGIWYAFNHGALRVSSNSKAAEITVTPAIDPETVSATGSDGSLFTVLPNGDYIVIAKEGEKQQKTLVTVSAFGTVETTLNPPELLGVEPVTNLAVPIFAASKNNLSMIDVDSAKIVSVSQDNTYTFSDGTYQFESGVWTSAGNGYAVARNTADQQKRFLQITDGSIRELALPNAFNNQTYLAFNTSPSGELYVMQDGVFYKRSTDGAYSKIVQTNKQALVQSVSKKYATLFYRDTEEQCEYQFVSLEKKTIKKMPVSCVQSPGYSFSAKWSADEKYLALTTGDYLAVYNQDFVEQYKIPDPRAAHPNWLSSNELAYVSTNNIWTYNVDTKTSSAIGVTPPYISIQSMKKADDSNTLYFLGGADELITLYRTVAASDTITPIQKLADSNMHELDYFCHIRYMNFISPKLIASTSPIMQSECTTIIEEYLASMTVPSLPIQYILDEEFGYLD